MFAKITPAEYIDNVVQITRPAPIPHSSDLLGKYLFKRIGPDGSRFRQLIGKQVGNLAEYGGVDNGLILAQVKPDTSWGRCLAWPPVVDASFRREKISSGPKLRGSYRKIDSRLVIYPG